MSSQHTISIRAATGAAAARRGVLSESALASADQLGRRLQAELRDVMALLPEDHRSASAMSRLLKLDRATCQRIVQGAMSHDAGPRTLIALPGIAGLRSFLVAVSERVPVGVGGEVIAGASAAIDRFAGFLDEVGLSQRGLRAALEGPEGRAPRLYPPADDSLAREALFLAAAEVVGRWSEAAIHTSIIRPVPGDPTLTDWARVRALVQHRWRTHAVPLEVGGTATLRGGNHGPSMDSLESNAAASPLVTEFCSKPLPLVVAKAAGKRVVHVIDTDSAGGQGPADIVTATRVAKPDPSPATLTPAIGEVWALQNIPARRLVFDTFIHKDLAAACVPSIEAHLWMPDVGIRHDAARWSTRLPGGPSLEPISPIAAATSAHAAYEGMLSHVFDELRWPREEFVGFRCDIPYPVWRGGYVMLFDFAATSE